MAWPMLFTREQAGPDTHLWARRLFPFALFLLALAPRLVAINRYITPDELLWVYRSIQLREAITDGRWSDTLVAGHPGVTTTWLGTAGISVQLAANPAAQTDYDWLTHLAALLPDNVTAFTKLSGFLTAGRIAVAVANSLAIVLIYWLVRRLWGGGVAALAAVLLALDPFSAGLSGLLHVDALSASFATLSLLALGAAAARPSDEDRPWRFLGLLAFSGATAGLAFLTKTPTIVLAAVAAPAFGLWFLLLGGPILSPPRRRLVWGVAAWGGALALTMLMVLPALWVGPGAVLTTLSGNANRHLDEALRPTFFLGRVAFDHGFLFYPAVLLWRNGPVVLGAIVPFVLLLWGRKRGLRGQIAGPNSYLPLFILLGWIAGFVLLISVAAKKFDRYALPVIPALIILAALVWFVWSRRGGRRRSRLPWALVAVQAVYLLLYIGYPLAAYDPLVGGPYTAIRVLPMGWGEGISAAGRWLTATIPDAAGQSAMAGVAPSLAPFFAGQTVVEGVVPATAADYVIHTLGGAQLDDNALDAKTAGLDLVQTIRFGGLDQAWVYRNPAPIAAPRPPVLSEPVVFGERFALLAAGTGYADDVAHIALEWGRRAPLAPDDRPLMRIAVRDAGGAIWASQETDLLNDVYFYPPDWLEDASGVVHIFLEMPPAMPPDTYIVEMTVVDSRTGDQFAARTASGTVAGVTYPLGNVTVPRPEQVVSAARVQIPQASDQTWLDGRLQLLGTSRLPDEVLAGSRLPLDLFWHAPSGGLPDGLLGQWWLQPTAASEPLAMDQLPVSRLDPASWRAGETVNEKVRLKLPPTAPPGPAEVVLELRDSTGATIGPRLSLGSVVVNNIDRSYELPPGLPLEPQTCFGAVFCLAGIAPEHVPMTPGQPVDLSLYWQVQTIPDAVYTVFLHVVDQAGNIVGQADHWPGGLPTDILAEGQVITDRVTLPMPGDLNAGSYDLRLGLYAPGDGARLPVTSSTLPAGEDYLLLPDFFTVAGP